MKKLISLLAACSMLPIVQPVFAKEKLDLTQKTEVLEGLNIIGENIPQSITWGDYLSAIEGMMSDNKSEDSITFAENRDLIGKRVTSEETITYEDALKILVRAGGYADLAPGYSETSAYIRTAGERKLTDGITLSYSDTLTSDAMISMLYNALDADIMDVTFDGNKYKIETKSDETILSRYRKIKEQTGILSDNGDSGLNSDEAASKNSIVVGKSTIAKNNNYKKDYLGYNVRVFYKDDYGDYSLMYLYPEKNRELSLSGEDISGTDSAKLYYETDDKQKSVKLDAAIKVIYNGQAYFDYTDADFTADENDVTLVDNNDDGTYEIALISSYETIVASYVTKYDGKIVNKYKYSGAPDGLDISSDSDDYKVRYYVDGERVEKPEIKIWDVLSIATSKGTNPIRSIYISTGSIQGIISQTGEDKYIIDDEEYKLNSAFKAAKAAGDTAVPEITLGAEYTIYLDIHGRIAAVSSTAAQQLGYAVMIKMLQDDDDEEIVRVKYMDSAGDWHESYLRKRVKFYDDTNDGKSLKASEIFNVLADSNKKVIPQVVQLCENADGEINVLKTAVSSQKPIKNKLTVGKTVTGCFRWTTRLLGNYNDIALYVADGATIFLMPDNEYSTNEHDYGVRMNSLTADEVYTVTPYNADKYNVSDCLVMKDSDGGVKADNLFIVSHVSKIVDSEDEVKTALYGQYGEYSDYSVIANDNSLFDGLQRGDVLELYRNNKSEIVKLNKVYTSASGFNPTFQYEYHGKISGFVEEVDADAKRLLIDCGQYGVKGILSNDSFNKVNVYLIDRSKKGVQRLDFSDIQKGDFVVMTLNFASLNNVIIIK